MLQPDLFQMKVENIIDEIDSTSLFQETEKET